MKVKSIQEVSQTNSICTQIIRFGDDNRPSSEMFSLSCKFAFEARSLSRSQVDLFLNKTTHRSQQRIGAGPFNSSFYLSSFQSLIVSIKNCAACITYNTRLNFLTHNCYLINFVNLKIKLLFLS